MRAAAVPVGINTYLGQIIAGVKCYSDYADLRILIAHEKLNVLLLTNTSLKNGPSIQGWRPLMPLS